MNPGSNRKFSKYHHHGSYTPKNGLVEYIHVLLVISGYYKIILRTLKRLIHLLSPSLLPRNSELVKKKKKKKPRPL